MKWILNKEIITRKRPVIISLNSTQGVVVVVIIGIVEFTITYEIQTFHH
jgi:hypothetical protein